MIISASKEPINANVAVQSLWMKPYWVVFTGTFQQAFVYRARILTYAFINTFSPVVMILIWSEYYRSGQSVSGYSYGQLVSYYLAVILVSLIISRVQSTVVIDIKDGSLSNYVIKPFKYFLFRAFWELAWYAAKIISFAIPLFIIIYLIKLPLGFVNDWSRILLTIVAFILAYFLSFTFSMFIGLLAFFITDSNGLDSLSRAASEILTGKLFPITFFPPLVQRVVDYSPFKFMVYFPAFSLIGRYQLPEMLNGIALGITWTVVLVFLCWFCWKKGIEKFSAVGL